MFQKERKRLKKIIFVHFICLHSYVKDFFNLNIINIRLKTLAPTVLISPNTRKSVLCCCLRIRVCKVLECFYAWMALEMVSYTCANLAFTLSM